MGGNAVQVLLVEDDDVDVLAVKRAFRAKKIANELLVARDGVEALAMLRGAPGYRAVGRPYVILLDLNLPRLNGLEFLEIIRKDPDLETAVVFVLTTSKADEDRTAAYRQHVAGYMVKQDIGEGLMAMVELLDAYWRIVELP